MKTVSIDIPTKKEMKNLSFEQIKELMVKASDLEDIMRSLYIDLSRLELDKERKEHGKTL